MEDIQKWRDTFSWFVAAMTVAVSYEIRTKGYIHLPSFGSPFVDDMLLAAIPPALLLLSLLIAKWASKFLISRPWFRAYILGENYVEGFWFLQTDPPESINSEESSKSHLSPSAVLWLRYHPSWGQYTVSTTRLNRKGETYHTTCKIVNMRAEGPVLLYVNYFTIDNEGDHSIEGVAKGKFTKVSDSSRRKDRLESYIFTQGEKTRHQKAERISLDVEKKCRLLARQSGTGDWMQEFLKGSYTNSSNIGKHSYSALPKKIA